MKTEGWPYNGNAVGFCFGLGLVGVAALEDNTPYAILGLSLCLLWATTQICQTIKETRQ